MKRNDPNLIGPLGTGCAACLVNNTGGKFMQMCANPPTSQSFHFSIYIFPPPQSTWAQQPLRWCLRSLPGTVGSSSGLLMKSLPLERFFLLLKSGSRVFFVLARIQFPIIISNWKKIKSLKVSTVSRSIWCLVGRFWKENALSFCLVFLLFFFF